MVENTLWVEKYRPKTLDEYVGNDDIKGKLSNWLEQDDIPHLLFYGSAGCGKTSIAKLIGKHLDCDLLYINASDENSIDTIRDKIRSYVSSGGFGKYKLVILDEADFATVNFQAALRNLLETFSATSRFILTCNYRERIIEPILSRLTDFNVRPPDKKSVAIRCKTILDSEGIVFDAKDLVTVVNRCYPDLRKTINYLQRNSLNGKLIIPEETIAVDDYCSKIVEELKNIGDVKETFTNIRQIIADAKVRQFDDLFKHLFETLPAWAPDGKRAGIILTIADYQFKSENVLDKEIQVAAMIINILRDLKS